MRPAAERGVLALLVELAATPTPGNVDRDREYPDLRFAQFLAGAVGAADGLDRAARGDPVGECFEDAVAGMARLAGTNTQFGALLLLVPLVRAAADDECSRSGVASVVADTTVADAAAFYRAFEHVDVAVGEPPPDATDLDVRRGADAVPAVEERGLSLADVLALSAPEDGVAAEWDDDYERTFRAGEAIVADEGPLADRAARAFLDLLAERPDSLVARRHGPDVAAEVRDRAADLGDRDPAVGDYEAVSAFADDLVARGINPGTTADVLAAATFVAIDAGVEP